MAKNKIADNDTICKGDKMKKPFTRASIMRTAADNSFHPPPTMTLGWGLGWDSARIPILIPIMIKANYAFPPFLCLVTMAGI